MTNQIKRGEVWLANLNPTQGSEQAGIRPVIIFQNDIVSQFSTTILAIPLTTNQRRASLPICMAIAQGDGGLVEDSVALCFQNPHFLRRCETSRFQPNFSGCDRLASSMCSSSL